jgi:threonine dehydrogenase-like Zn-dependent dehydrogenase
MAIAGQITIEDRLHSIPATMLAAVYRGMNDVRLETVLVPAIGPGELLLKVHTCGVCGTDLKKIATGSHSAPRIFGHETSGVVAAVGAGVHIFQPGETVLAIGQGPIGIILSVLARRAGATVITSDLYPERLKIAKSLGLQNTVDASKDDVVNSIRERTEGRGADAAILAVGSNALIRPAMDAVRPGGRVLLFAQTQRGEVVVDPAAICVDEKTLLGSYSASVDLQEASVQFVMNREMDLERLISHRFPLQEASRALDLAAHPQPSSMKVVIQPGLAWKQGAWEGSNQ